MREPVTLVVDGLLADVADFDEASNRQSSGIGSTPTTTDQTNTAARVADLHPDAEISPEAGRWAA